MLAMSTSKEFPFTCLAPSLGMAIETLATDPYGLCWPYEGKDGLNSSGCTLQMAGGSRDVKHFTIPHLRSLFARFGLPEQCVSDNGLPFNSEDFTTFMKGNRIKHICSSPYQPATNSLAERFVQTFKRALIASEGNGRPVHHRFASFLLSYRNAPHATMNRSPCELFLKRALRTRMDLLRPDGLVNGKQAGS